MEGQIWPTGCGLTSPGLDHFRVCWCKLRVFSTTAQGNVDLSFFGGTEVESPEIINVLTSDSRIHTGVLRRDDMVALHDVVGKTDLDVLTQFLEGLYFFFQLWQNLPISSSL